MTLNVDKKNALKDWREADNKGKQMLENLYGKEIFANQNVMDRIKTFEDAMEETGRKGVPDFSDLPKDMRKHFIALYKMEVITEALNEGWKADWDNSDENKYYPYFTMSPSSFALCVSYCVYACAWAVAGCGSRLFYKTRELAEYSAKQFIDIWKNIQIG